MYLNLERTFSLDIWRGTYPEEAGVEQGAHGVDTAYCMLIILN